MSLCICCDFMCLCIQRQVTKALSISFKQSLDLHYKIFVHRLSCTQRMLSYPLLCCVCPPLSWYFFQIPSASQHPLGPQTSVSQQAQQAPLIKHHLGAAVALATPTINTYWKAQVLTTLIKALKAFHWVTEASKHQKDSRCQPTAWALREDLGM